MNSILCLVAKKKKIALSLVAGLVFMLMLIVLSISVNATSVDDSEVGVTIANGNPVYQLPIVYKSNKMELAPAIGFKYDISIVGLDENITNGIDTCPGGVRNDDDDYPHSQNPMDVNFIIDPQVDTIVNNKIHKNIEIDFTHCVNSHISDYSGEEVPPHITSAGIYRYEIWLKGHMSSINDNISFDVIERGFKRANNYDHSLFIDVYVEDGTDGNFNITKYKLWAKTTDGNFVPLDKIELECNIYDVTLTNSVIGSEDALNKDYLFAFSNQDYYLSEMSNMSIIKNGIEQTIVNSASRNYDFTLNHGDTITFKNLPFPNNMSYNYRFKGTTIAESDLHYIAQMTGGLSKYISGYHYCDALVGTSDGFAVRTASDVQVQINTIENKILKLDYDVIGLPDGESKDFTFNITADITDIKSVLTNEELRSSYGVIHYDDSPEINKIDSAPFTFTDTTASYTGTLKSSEYYELRVPATSQLKITETDNRGYTVSHTKTNSADSTTENYDGSTYEGNAFEGTLLFSNVKIPVEPGVIEANGNPIYSLPISLTTNKENVTVPNTETTILLSSAESADLSGDIKAGIMPTTTPTLSGSFTQTDVFENKQITKNVDIDLSSVTFSSAGVYRYVIEMSNFMTTIDADSTITYGIMPDSNNKRYLDVYVENDTDNNLKIAYYVLSIPQEDGSTIKSIGFENQYNVHDFTLTKEVTGSAGDKQRDFTFTVTFDKYSLLGAKPLVTKNGTNEDIDVSADGLTYTILLANNETVNFANVPEHANYTIIESNNTGYTTNIVATGDTLNTIDNTTYKISDKLDETLGINDPASGTGGLTVDTQITYTNNKESVLPTGIILITAIPTIIGLTTIGGIGAFIAIKRKDEYDGN